MDTYINLKKRKYIYADTHLKMNDNDQRIIDDVVDHR